MIQGVKVSNGSSRRHDTGGQGEQGVLQKAKGEVNMTGLGYFELHLQLHTFRSM